MSMNETTQLFFDTTQKLFSDQVSKECIEESEKGIWPEKLWNEAVENGLNLVIVPEEFGGVGGTWMDAGVIFKLIGKFQAPIPLAENILSSYLLSLGNINAPDDSILTMLNGSFEFNDGFLSGEAPRTPFSSHATHGVLLFENNKDIHVALIKIEKKSIKENTNLALESRGHISLDKRKPINFSKINAKIDLSFKLGALVRANQMAGALESLLEQSVQYANERIQFGRPIGKFQAIQQQLAILSTHVAASGVAADYASFSMDKGNPDLAIAVAKSRIDDAVSIGASIAHQVHGAIGFTYEHGLHFATRRLWSWRSEYGSGSYWSQYLGKKAVENGAEKLWPSITEGNLNL